MWHVNPTSGLFGKINASGAKNSMQFLVTSALLTFDPVKLYRVPFIRDIYTLSCILEELGCEVYLDQTTESILIRLKTELRNWCLPIQWAKKLRSSLLFIPGLLHAFGKALIPFPGGDNIGERPLDTHFYILNKFGCEVEQVEKGYLISSKKLSPCKLELPFPSFTGTGLAMMIAAKLNGITIIENAGQEPELGDLAQMLRLMGVGVEGIGNRSLVIHGNPILRGAEMKIMPDRLEVGTFLMATAITKGEINFPLEEIKNLEILVEKLTDAGCVLTEKDGMVTFSRRNDMRAQSIITGPHPSFTTDLQPQFMALMTQANGKSQIIEKMHTNRYLQVPYLNRMGAKVSVSGNCAMIDGPSQLYGTKVEAKDIRGGASLVIAALAAQGETYISGQYHLDRGFSDFRTKLCSLGANIELEPEPELDYLT